LLQNTFNKRHIFPLPPTLSVFEPPLVGRSPVSAWSDLFRGQLAPATPSIVAKSTRPAAIAPKPLSPLSSSFPSLLSSCRFAGAGCAFLLYVESRRILHGFSAGVIVQYFYLHPIAMGLP
jgi:hypothetical protein